MLLAIVYKKEEQKCVGPKSIKSKQRDTKSNGNLNITSTLLVLMSCPIQKTWYLIHCSHYDGGAQRDFNSTKVDNPEVVVEAVTEPMVDSKIADVYEAVILTQRAKGHTKADTKT